MIYSSEIEVLIMKAMRLIHHFEWSFFCLWVLRIRHETGVNTCFHDKNTSQIFEKNGAQLVKNSYKHVFSQQKRQSNF